MKTLLARSFLVEFRVQTGQERIAGINPAIQLNERRRLERVLRYLRYLSR